MILTVLVGNKGDDNTPGEHGLSYLIEYEGFRFLFDSGQSSLFLQNAGNMGIDLSVIDTVVLSHGYFDHGKGRMLLWIIKRICCCSAFL